MFKQLADIGAELRAPKETRKREHGSHTRREWEQEKVNKKPETGHWLHGGGTRRENQEGDGIYTTGKGCAHYLLRAWRAICVADETHKEAKRQLRAESRSITREMGRELLEAETQGDTAAVWKYTRLLAGTGRGPRNRAYNVPAADVPDSEAWEAYLAQSGPKGDARDGRWSAQRIHKGRCNAQGLRVSGRTTLSFRGACTIRNPT